MEQFDREHILVFFRKFRVVSVCFETVLFVSVVLILVQNTETNRNKQNFFLFFVSRNKPKQILFRFEPKFFFVCFEDTLITENIGVQIVWDSKCGESPNSGFTPFPRPWAGYYSSLTDFEFEKFDCNCYENIYSLGGMQQAVQCSAWKIYISCFALWRKQHSSDIQIEFAVEFKIFSEMKKSFAAQKDQARKLIFSRVFFVHFA
jgi:hypothetical protein